MKGSRKFKLNTRDLKKIGIGILIALGGALVTYVAETVPNVDFGAWTPTVVAINSVLVNTMRKFITNYSERQDDIMD